MKIIQVKAAAAFLIPFLTGLGAAIQPYASPDAAMPNVVGWMVIVCVPTVAGLSALSSFLSTAWTDYKAMTPPPAAKP